MAKQRIPSWLRAVLPWLVTALLLALVFRKVDFSKVLADLKGANLKLFLPSIIIFSVYTFVINSFLYTKLFNWFSGPVRFMSVLSIRGASFLLGSIYPAAGQGGLLLWVAKKENLSFKNVLSAAILVPVMDVVFLQIILMLVIVFHYLVGSMISATHIGFLSLAVLAITLAELIFFLVWAKWGKRIGERFEGNQWLRAFREAKPRHCLIILGIRFAQHLPNILAYYLCFMSFVGVIPFIKFIIRFIPALVIQYLPITIAQVGTAQSGWILMFRDMVDINKIVAFTLSWNVVFLISRIILGAIFFRGEVKEFFKGEWKEKAAKQSA